MGTTEAYLRGASDLLGNGAPSAINLKSMGPC